MPGSFVNRVQERCHLKPPVYKDKAMVMTYRLFDVEEVTSAFRHSKISLQLQKSYSGDEVIPVRPRLSGMEAIEAAKAQVHPGSSHSNIPSITSMEVKIIVGEGEGRLTREFEMIWWPNMFNTSGHGKLIFLYFIAKVRL